MKELKRYTKLTNRIILGLLMLVPGLLKIFVNTPEGVTGMLSGFGFPAPAFLAWVLIISEIAFGIAILANYKIKYTVIPPMIILLGAAFTANWGSWPSFLLHIAAVANYGVLGAEAYTKKSEE